MKRKKVELGRNPRAAQAAVDRAISKYKSVQARKFAEHGAKPREAQVQSGEVSGAELTAAPAHRDIPDFGRGKSVPINKAIARYKDVQARKSAKPPAQADHREDSRKPPDFTLTKEQSERLQYNRTPDMQEHHGGNAPDLPRIERGNIDFKERRQRLELKSTSRAAAPAPTVKAISRYNETQARKFAEHEAQSAEVPFDKAQNTPVITGRREISEPPKKSSLQEQSGRLHFSRAPDVSANQPRRRQEYRGNAAYTPPAMRQHSQDSTAADNPPPSAPVLLLTDGKTPATADISALAPMPETAIEPIIAESVPPSQALGPVEHNLPDSEGSSSTALVLREPTQVVESGRPKKDSKLKFGDEVGADTPDRIKSAKKLAAAERKFDRSSEKLENARKKLPKKRVLRTSREFDAEKGKMKPRLRFEEEVKTQREHLRGPLITRPFKAGANAAIGFAHKKIYQSEDENVSVKAAHRGELFVESRLRSAYRHHKLAPYRKVQKLERRTAKLHMNATYRKALHDNPELAKKPLSRMIQKRKIKRQYAKAAREAQRAGRIGAKVVLSKVKVVAGKFATKVAALLVNPKVLIIVGILALIMILIFGLISACSGMATGIGSSFAAMSYLAEDEDIDDAALLYSELETDLRIYIRDAEENHPNFDEYRFDIGAIGHEPLMLMAYLTAVYHEFTFAEVEPILREIFAAQYMLELVPEVEARTRMEIIGGQEVVIEYEWRILNVTLAVIPLEEVLASRMSDEQRLHYALLMQSRGLRQIVASPFAFNWQPFVSSPYGWRIHPVTGTRDLHLGIDIAVLTGTPILAAHGGAVTFAGDSGSYGLLVIIDDGNGLVTKYAHCDTLLVSAGQTVAAGDVIATVGSTGSSTGMHLHFELIKNGRRLNPIFFALTGN